MLDKMFRERPLGEEVVLFQLLVFSVGFFSWYLTAHWANAVTYADNQQPTLNLYAFVSFFLIIFGAAGLTRRSNLFVSIFDKAAGAISCAGLLVLVLFSCDAFPTDPFHHGGALALIGAGEAWFFVRWGTVYAQINLQLSTASLFLGGIVVALVKVIASIVPFCMSSLLIALTPIASTLALQTIPLERLRTHGECRWTQPGALRPLLPLAAAIALFFLLWSVFNMILKTSTGHYSLGPEASFPLGLVTHLLVVGILALVAYGFLGHSRPFDFYALWRLLYVFLAVSLLATVYLGISQVIQVCTSAAIELGFVFFWMLIVDVARHSSLPSQAILGFGGLLQAIPDWVGRSLVALFDIQELGSHAIAILFFVIVATVAFLLPHRSPTVQLLFSEVNAEKSQTSERASLEEACAHLSAKAGLSQREGEILELLCRGRSKPYIAETLFLSENTVRTYTRSMYRKLNVHSKQELLDLVEDEAERSD